MLPGTALSLLFQSINLRQHLLMTLGMQSCLSLLLCCPAKPDCGR